MYDNRTFLAIIPARGGSKGLPKKNIKLLGGKELLAWSIESAKESVYIDKCIVSSDNDDIINTAIKHGAEVPFIRPSLLATDTATTEDVLIHALKYYENKLSIKYDYVVLLQPTSPFRESGDIDKAILSAIKTDADMVVSVKETSSNPYYVLFEENHLGFLEKSKKGSFTRRQDCPKVYEYNGSIYVIKAESLLKSKSRQFKKTIKYKMQEFYSIDIDNEIDFMYAEFLLEKKLINTKT